MTTTFFVPAVTRRSCAMVRVQALFIVALGIFLACASAAFAAPPNKVPNVALTAPANGAVFTAGANIAISATATDADGTIAKVVFYRGGTTVLGTLTSSPYSMTWASVAAGSYSLTAIATDNKGATRTSAAVNISVTAPPNVPPTVALTSPSNGSSFVAPASISIGANASDSDGTIAKVEFFQGATSIGAVTTAPFTIVWNNVSVGSYVLTAKTTDNFGAVATSASVTISVATVNAAPMVVLTAPFPCTVYDAPASLVLAADALDRDGRIAKVEFIAGNVVIGLATAAPYLFAWSNVAEGTYTLAARATDQLGASTTSTPVTITVRGTNQPPVVSLTSPVDGATFAAPTSIALAASASDPDGSIARVEFVVDGTVVGSAGTTPYVYSWTAPGIGTHQIAARATDNLGAITNSAVSRISVLGPPIAQIISPANGTAYIAAANIAITATASATAGPVTQLDFYDGPLPIGSISTSATQVNATFNFTGVPAGAHSLSVRATDAAGLTGASAPVPIVVNALPMVAIASPQTGANFGAPATIVVSASASVPFGSISKVEFFAGASLLGAVTNSPYQVTWNNVAPGFYLLTATATTSAGLTTTSNSVPVSVNSIDFNVNSPADGTTVYESDVVVGGAFSGAVPSTVTVNGVPASLGNASFAAVVPLISGNNLLNVVAVTPQGTVSRTLSITRADPSFVVTNVTSGQTIADDTVSLVGTAKAPANSAISVNGRLAALTPDGRFFVNNLPLVEGNNSIAIALNTPEAAAQPGAFSASQKQVAKRNADAPGQTLDLIRNGMAPFTLEVENPEGLAPLTVNVQLKNRLAYYYDKLNIDTNGDGRIDYVEDGLPTPLLERDFSITYDAPGVYPLTFTLTRQGSEIVYTATRMIHVKSVAAAADGLRDVFTSMLQRLAAGDVARAAQSITNTVRGRYSEAFTRLTALLTDTVAGIGSVESVTMGPDFAELSIVREVADGTDHFSVLLIRDGDGIWRIDGM